MIDAEHAANFLNRVFEIDPDTASMLVGVRIRCSKELASLNIPLIHIPRDSHYVSPLGLINGMLGGPVVEVLYRTKFLDKNIGGFRAAPDIQLAE